jgi:hypothetical protein
MEMFRENRELQKSEVSSNEIVIFVDMLRRIPMHPLYLGLLAATCECSGIRIEKNQQVRFYLLSVACCSICV